MNVEMQDSNRKHFSGGGLPRHPVFVSHPLSLPKLHLWMDVISNVAKYNTSKNILRLRKSKIKDFKTTLKSRSSQNHDSITGT